MSYDIIATTSTVVSQAAFDCTFNSGLPYGMGASFHRVKAPTPFCKANYLSLWRGATVRSWALADLKAVSLVHGAVFKMLFRSKLTNSSRVIWEQWILHPNMFKVGCCICVLHPILIIAFFSNETLQCHSQWTMNIMRCLDISILGMNCRFSLTIELVFLITGVES